MRPYFESMEAHQVILVVEAWHALGADRHLGMSLGCIPFTAILRWSEWYGLDRDATNILVDVIRILDRDRVDREESRRRMEHS